MTKPKPPSQKAGQPKPPVRNARKGVNNSWSSPERIRRAERMATALNWRKQGFSYHQIAAKMKEPMNTVYDLVIEALKEIKREPAEHVLELELARADELLASVFKDATKGKDAKIATALRISERRSKLLGLDKPQELELSGEIGVRKLDLTDKDRARAMAAFIAKVKAKGG